MTEFIKIIREKLELSPERALFFLVNGKHSLTLTEDLGQVYDKFKDKSDGFLYMTYSEEIVYGWIFRINNKLSFFIKCMKNIINLKKL